MIKKLLCGLAVASLLGVGAGAKPIHKPRLNISLGETNVKLIQALELTRGLVPTVPKILRCTGTPQISNIAWVQPRVDGSKTMRVCKEWVDLFTVEELALVLLHESHHYRWGIDLMMGGLISRELAEESADIYSFEVARHLGISRNACESEIKIAQVFKANPFRKYSANYPSQASRFARCIQELSIKIS